MTDSMNVTESRRVVITDPTRVVVKYADGEELQVDNDVTEVLIEGDYDR